MIRLDTIVAKTWMRSSRGVPSLNDMWEIRAPFGNGLDCMSSLTVK